MSLAQPALVAGPGAGSLRSAGVSQRLLGLLLAAPATLWLLGAFAAPLLAVVLLALHEDADPFGPLWQAPSAAQFLTIASDPFYLRLVGETLALGAGVTLLSALLGYPLALWLTRLPARWRSLGFAVILIPLLTNVVVRSLGVVLLLAPDGLINQALGFVGLSPWRGMLYTHGAVAIALAQVFMPFMVLSLYDVLQGASPRILEAAESLGASPMARLLLVTLPLSLPGLRAGIIIVFLMSSTAYVSATLLGGKKVLVVGMIVWQEALQNLNAPLASALALVMTATSTLFAVGVYFIARRLTPWVTGRPTVAFAIPPTLLRAIDFIGPILGKLAVASALVLLLLPLVLVCIQSFNDVPQATVAGFRAFTLKWYKQALLGGAYGASFLISAQLAFASALVAIALALPAAFALARYRFRGLGALNAFWMLPLSLPHIAIGVGMLRLLQVFVALPPFLGLMAVHVVLMLPFAISLLQASVEQLDRAQEEAAASLGAGPLNRLRLVTLPGLAPGLAATCIMSFLLSFGEVTVTSFLTTARMTTLPVRIYSEASFSLEPTVHAVSAMLIAATVVVLLVLTRLVKLDRLYAR
ncbi:ABC transporter permease subunit [Terrarubrum flagellatum]|uniref:ABC transporter permease subunit n=1 Tax=Terrirubrum flagellatum TaxID=2895980 RepID=UPI0031452B50